MGCLLIIGDIGPTLHDACYILRDIGIEIDVCTNVVDAPLTHRDYVLVVLDCQSGNEAALSCSYLRQNGGEFCLVVVAPSEREDDQLPIFDAGADDVISRPISSRLLAARVQAHVRRLGQVRQSGIVPIARSRGQGSISASPIITGIELTRIEARLFAALSATSGAPVTREALYTAGWPNNERVMPQTLYVHLSALRRKLAPSGWSLQAVGGVGGGGYCLKMQREPSLPPKRKASGVRTR